MSSERHFREGISSYESLRRHEKNWVTSKLIQRLSLPDRRALADFMESMLSAEKTIESGASVFLSHSGTDKRFVSSLAHYMKAHGLRVWLDEADLLACEALLERLSHSVIHARLLLAVLSKQSVASRWVQKELALAVHAEVTEGSVRIIPILKDDCEIPSFLKDKLYLDFRTKDARRKNRPVLIDTIMKLGARPAPTPPT